MNVLVLCSITLFYCCVFYVHAQARKDVENFEKKERNEMLAAAAAMTDVKQREDAEMQV